MARQKTTRQASGGARLIASGRKPVLLGLTPEQYEKMGRAAEKIGLKLTQFLVFQGLAAAEKILGKPGNQA